MFRRRDEEENVIDAANADLKNADLKTANSFGNFGDKNNEAETAEKKEQVTTARSLFGVPIVKEIVEEKKAEPVGPQSQTEQVPQASVASGLFARPAAVDNNVSKPTTYKLSAGGALTPATSSNSATSQPNFNSGANQAQATTGAAMSNIDKIETEKRLTVGYGITLEGKISNCDKLIVYGHVHADLTDVKTLHISESGKFSGFAAIENAEISGIFEGDLIVENSIVINATGKMSGKVTYGSIEIKPGGKFTGQIVDAADAAPSERTKKTAKKKADENEEFKLSPEPVEVAKEKEELFA
jgi:cytoskeletal protein CcmA (bactofilin family)